MLSRRHLLRGLGGLAATAALPAAARAAMNGLPNTLGAPLPLSTPMLAGSFVPAPAAWFALLRDRPDLDPARSNFAPLRLTPGRAAQLVKVNKGINDAIHYRRDPNRDVWEVGGKEGDCEDYAIRKLAELSLVDGFPRGALTLAACRFDGGKGHAVLLVHSDRGVYVMDNLSPRVVPWNRLPYHWLAREEPGAPFRLWRDLRWQACTRKSPGVSAAASGVVSCRRRRAPNHGLGL